MEVTDFKDDLIVKSMGDKWVVVHPFQFYYEKILPNGMVFKKYIVIPEGFVTDFASTPKALYSIFPPVGIYNKATILHDYLYSHDSINYENLSLKEQRAIADKFLLQALEVLKVPKWKRNAMYLAVRLFGKKHFKK